MSENSSLSDARRLRRLWLPGYHYFRVIKFTNHLSLEVWLFGFRLNFKVEWSGNKTTHWWRIRRWGWRDWINTCVYHFKHGDHSFAHPGPDPGEALVARVALALGWTPHYRLRDV